MKKLIYSIALLCFFSTFQLIASVASAALPESQDIILIGGNDFSPRYNCTNSINVGIQVSNLTQITFGKGNNNYILPAGAPDMYVKFEMASISEVQQVSIFNPNGTVTGLDGNLYNLFKADLNFTVNSNDACSARGRGGSVNYTVSIITYDQYGVEIPYPICDYSNSSDIFSCSVFTVTAPFCSTRGNCNSGDINSASSNAGVDCDGGTCRSSSRNGDNSYENEFEKIASTNLLVNPNPFNNELTLQVFMAEGDIIRGIQLIDLNGKVLRTIDTNQLNHKSQLTINTSDLQSGIYIVSLQTDHQLISNKLIKQ